jgi:hypothetical protein
MLPILTQDGQCELQELERERNRPDYETRSSQKYLLLSEEFWEREKLNFVIDGTENGERKWFPR